LITIGACAVAATGATKMAAAAAARIHLRMDVFLQLIARNRLLFCFSAD
jgi:hypothetical protein